MSGEGMSAPPRIATTEAFALDLAARLQPRTGQDALLDDRPAPEPGERRERRVASVYSAAVIVGGIGFGVLEHWRAPTDPAGFLCGRAFLPLELAQRAVRDGL